MCIKIPKDSMPVYVEGKSGAYYKFEAYNFNNSFESINLNSSVFIALKELNSKKGDLSISSDIVVSYHAIWSIDDIVEGKYNFMAPSIAIENGAKHFFLLNWAGSQKIREQIVIDIKEGGHYNFEKDDVIENLFSFKG